MTIPYFLPLTIDGEERRPIVERVEACRPRVGKCSLELLDAVSPRLEGPILQQHGGVASCFAWVGEAQPDVDRDNARWRDCGVEDWLALKLSRLAVIEWLQANEEAAVKLGGSAIADGRYDALLGGADDTTYNDLAHRLCDAMGVAR